MPRKTPVGIKQIGAALGLSMMSVSRALRGVEGVSSETREHVLRTAKRMGYRPNRNARSLASDHSTLIGISLPTLFSDVFPEILDGMRATFDHAGFDTVIDTTDYNPAREADWVERMLDWNAAGLVLFTLGSKRIPASEAALLAALEVPLAPFWVWLLLGEEPAAATLIGGSIVLAALFAHIVFEVRGGRSAVVPPQG